MADRRVAWAGVLIGALLLLMGFFSSMTGEPYDYQLPLPPAYWGE